MSGHLQNMQLDHESFRSIAELTYRESGLILSQEKAAMIQSRLRKRLQTLDMPDFSTYSRYIHSKDGISERGHLISALTTNVSHFFREKHHFVALCDLVLKPKLDRLRDGGRLRIWSAGCSNGQEACSAAISLLEYAPEIADHDVRILGTDIDANVIRFARSGAYSAQDLNGLPNGLRDKYFDAEEVDGIPRFLTKPILRKMIQFNQLNLLSNWPMKRSFDVIFCRNVVIYFDTETQDGLWPRFRQQLERDGFLFLGHSERICAPETHAFKVSGPTTYAAI